MIKICSEIVMKSFIFKFYKMLDKKLILEQLYYSDYFMLRKFQKDFIKDFLIWPSNLKKTHFMQNVKYKYHLNQYITPVNTTSLCCTNKMFYSQGGSLSILIISECVLVGVKPIAREKTSRLIFMTFSEMIDISPIRTRKIVEFKNISLFLT